MGEILFSGELVGLSFWSGGGVFLCGEGEFLLGSGRGVFLGGNGDTILWSGGGSFFEEGDLFLFFDEGGGVTLTWRK